MGGDVICDKCGARWPHGARFCGACGNVFTLPAERLPLCTRCGTMMLAGRCVDCGGNEQVAVEGREDGSHWARISCVLTCQRCGRPNPFDHLDVDGEASCGACRGQSAFDPDLWRPVIGVAHDVADLRGPGRDRREAEAPAQLASHREVGITANHAHLEERDTRAENGVLRSRTYRAEVAPGHPMCERCASPLDAIVERGELAVRCASCSTTSRYAMPANARRWDRGLLGVLAPEHRIDQPLAKLDATSAGMVVAIHCPSCGGNLTPRAGEATVVCAFCRTESRLPSRTMLSLRAYDGKPQPFWVLFSGPSNARVGQPSIELSAPPSVVTKRKKRRRASDDDDDEKEEGSAEWENPIDASTIFERRARLVYMVVVPLIVLAVAATVTHFDTVWRWAFLRTSQEPAPTLPR